MVLLVVADKLKILHSAAQKVECVCDVISQSMPLFIFLFENCYNLELQQLITTLFYYLLPKVDSPDMKIVVSSRYLVDQTTLSSSHSSTTSMDSEVSRSSVESAGMDLGSSVASSESQQSKNNEYEISLVDYLFDIPGLIQMYSTMEKKREDDGQESNPLEQTHHAGKLDDANHSAVNIEKMDLESSSSGELEALSEPIPTPIIITPQPGESELKPEVDIERSEGLEAKERTQSKSEGLEDTEKEILDVNIVELQLPGQETAKSSEPPVLDTVEWKNEKSREEILNTDDTNLKEKSLHALSDSRWDKIGEGSLLVSRDIVNLLRYLNANSERWKIAIESRIEKCLDSNIFESLETSVNVQSISTLCLLSSDSFSSPAFLAVAPDIHHIGVVKEVSPGSKEAVIMFEENEVKYGL